MSKKKHKKGQALDPAFAALEFIRLVMVSGPEARGIAVGRLRFSVQMSRQIAPPNSFPKAEEALSAIIDLIEAVDKPSLVKQGS